MAPIVIPDTSPAELVARVRGRIFNPVADYSPSDPADLLGKVVVSAELDERTGNLTFDFSDGSDFRVISRPQEEPGDDLEHWDLFTPEGLVLFWGPGACWRLQGAHDPRW